MNLTKKIKNDSRITKKVISVVLATVMGVSGIAALIGCNKQASEKEGNSVVQPIDDLDLFADFDIENEEEVKQRAQAIYDISEKDYTVDQIQNLIYITNEKYANIEFSSSSKTDVQKFKEIQTYITGLNTNKTNSLFDDNIDDEVNYGAKLLANETTETLDTTDKYLYSYMLDATNDEEKALAGELAAIVNTQKSLIETKASVDELKVNSNIYYDLVEKIYKDKKKYSNNFLWNIDNQITDQNPLFTMFLTNKQVEFLDKQHRDLAANNALGAAIISELDLDTSDLKECESPTTPTGNYYNKEELKTYNEKQTTHKIPKEKQTTEKSSHVRYETVTESGKETTTKVVVTTGIPSTSKDESGKTTTKHTEEVKPGGEVVSTTKVVITDPALNTTTKPSTTKPNTTTKPSTTVHEDEIYLSPEEYEELLKSNDIQNFGDNKMTSTQSKSIAFSTLMVISGIGLVSINRNKYEEEKEDVKKR